MSFVCPSNHMSIAIHMSYIMSFVCLSNHLSIVIHAYVIHHVICLQMYISIIPFGCRQLDIPIHHSSLFVYRHTNLFYRIVTNTFTHTHARTHAYTDIYIRTSSSLSCVWLHSENICTSTFMITVDQPRIINVSYELFLSFLCTAFL